MINSSENKIPTPIVVAPNKIGHYILKHQIGEGAFSQVRLAIHDSTGQFYACKIIPKRRLCKDDLEIRFEQEIRIIQTFSHPGIALIYDLFKDSLNYYLILEYVTNGAMCDYIIKYHKISENQAKIFFKQVVETLKYIHQRGVAHRDIKPENILLTEDFNIKFIDFGLSSKVKQNELFTTKCGTPSYTAPEVIKGEKYDGFKSDIWSCGVLLFVMVFGQLPWTKSYNTQLLAQISKAEYFVPISASSELQDLIPKMMNPNVDERITIEEILNHPWFKDVQSSFKMSHNENHVKLSLEQVEDFFEFKSPLTKSSSTKTNYELSENLTAEFIKQRSIPIRRLLMNKKPIKRKRRGTSNPIVPTFS